MGEQDGERPVDSANAPEPVAGQDVTIGPVADNVVAVLENMLARAKVGQLQSVACCGSLIDGGTFNVWQLGEGQGVERLVFGVQVLNQRLLLGK